MRVMRSVVLRRHGGPEVLESAELPVPEPGPGQVRVAVRAVSINHLDLWVRRGGPAFHLEYPHRLGSDIAGVVHAVGAGVDDVEVGARTVVSPGLSCGVCRACLHGQDNLCPRYGILGETRSGGYCQYIVVPRQNLAPYPGELSFAEAASTLLTFLTAWQMVVRKAAVRPGETVLVQGAGSGVGVAAVQIARLHGARVIATAGSEAKLARLRALGADETIDYRSTDFVAAVKDATERRGADVVIEHVGGETFTNSVKATANGGRVVTCGATAGPKPTIDLRHIFFRQVSVIGSTMGSKGDLLEVLAHLGAGRLRPVVDRVMPLADAAEAHRLLEARSVFGKLVLEP